MTILWKGDHTAKNYGMGGLQGVCHAIQLDRTIISPDGEPSICIAVDDADHLIDPADNTPCGRSNRTDANAAVLLGPQHAEGEELWFRHAVYVPLDQPLYTGAPTRAGRQPGGPACFPLMRADQHMGVMLWEWYGPPFGGSPGVSYSINTDRRNDRNCVKFGGPPINGQAPWETEVLYDQWMLFGTHALFSQDPTEGFVEIEYQENPVTFTDGSTRLVYATIAPSHKDGPQTFYAGMNYRGVGVTPGLLSLHYDSAQVKGNDHSDVNY